MQTGGDGICSAGGTLLSNFLASAALSVSLAIAQGADPRGCSKTVFMFNFLLEATSSMWPNILRSLLSTTSLLHVFFVMLHFMLSKVFRLNLGIFAPSYMHPLLSYELQADADQHLEVPWLTAQWVRSVSLYDID